MRDASLMEPTRVPGGSTRAPLVLGVLLLAGVVGVGAAPHFLGPDAQPAGSRAVPPATVTGRLPVAKVGSVAPVPSPTPPTAVLLPSYPPPAVATSEFWVEIQRKGRMLQRVPLVRRPDGSQSGTIPIPVVWRRRLPIIALFGRTVQSEPPSRLLSVRLTLPEMARHGPAFNLAGGLTAIIDTIPDQRVGFHPVAIIGYVHTWSYSADLQWAIAGGPELVVTVAPQPGVY
jgi:hypothetical protein